MSVAVRAADVVSCIIGAAVGWWMSIACSGFAVLDSLCSCTVSTLSDSNADGTIGMEDYECRSCRLSLASQGPFHDMDKTSLPTK